MKNKGYFFVIDAFIGSIIIFASLFIIFNSQSNFGKVPADYIIADDYQKFVMNTKIEDMDNSYVLDLVDRGIIKNPKNTLVEQTTEFYYAANYLCVDNQPGDSCYDNNMSYAVALAKNVSEPLIKEKYSFSYLIIDEANDGDIYPGHVAIIYNRTNSDIADADLAILSKSITFIQINSSSLFGPVLTEIKIWS